MSLKDPLLSVSLFCHLASIILCALILFETLALYKSFTYLLTYNSSRKWIGNVAGTTRQKLRSPFLFFFGAYKPYKPRSKCSKIGVRLWGNLERQIERQAENQTCLDVSFHHGHWRSLQYTYHRPLKIRTDGGHARIGIFKSIFYCNFVKRGPFVTKFCTHSARDNGKNVANLVTVWFLLSRVCIYCGWTVLRSCRRLWPRRRQI